MACNKIKSYKFNYIINETEIENEAIFNKFDSNYLNLNMLPFIYYPIDNKSYYDNFINILDTDSAKSSPLIGGSRDNNDKIKAELELTLKLMKNPNILYNRYLITPITITVVIVWIFLFLFLLKLIHYKYNIIYLYLISSTIILLLIFGSIWFLYVNSQLL
jgi:hypothetical protein